MKLYLTFDFEVYEDAEEADLYICTAISDAGKEYLANYTLLDGLDCPAWTGDDCEFGIAGGDQYLARGDNMDVFIGKLAGQSICKKDLAVNSIALPTDKKFAIIYADPPWHYNDRALVGKSGKEYYADDHYPTMKKAELEALPVGDIAADDCLLFMWAVSPKLDTAMDVGKAWGFKYATLAFVWYKKRSLIGRYTMGQCEFCLVFKKGKIPQPRGARNIRQFCEARIGNHSEKPFEIRDRIDAMFPTQEKIELFARRVGLLPNPPRWTLWGNEAVA